MEDEDASSGPSPDDSIRVLQQLLAMWHGRDGQVALPLIANTPLPGLAIHVQVEHAMELTESIIVLISHHQYLTTAPLIRLTMECAVTAMWWAHNTAGVWGSIHSAMTLRERRIAGMRGGSPRKLADTPELRGFMADCAKYASEEARLIEKRCNAIPGGAWIYPYYRFLSEASHGGPNLLDEYTSEIPVSLEAPEGIGLVQRPHYKDLDIALGLQVVMLTLAMSAWDFVSPSHPDRNELLALSDQLGFGEFIREASMIRKADAGG